MDLYVPDAPAASPPIVVALHYCSGMSSNAHGWLQSYADQHGFAIITPQAGGNCFDAAPSRSGERANVVAMVNYVIMQKGADPKRVFAVGASSGACMTQALLAAYPEVFAAGSSLAGVPAGAWTGGNSYAWSTSGTSGGQGWGDKVRNANPGYGGARPRVQLWHGQGDTTLTYSQAYPAQVAQWTNVFGVDDSDATMESIKPMGAQDTWARTSYKDAAGVVVLEANSGPSNVPHDLSGRGLWGDIVRFFALDQPAMPGSGGAGGMGGTGSGGMPAGGTAGTGVPAGGAGMMGNAGTGMASAGAGSGGTAPSAGTGGSAAGAPPGAGGMPAATGGVSSGAGRPAMGTGGSAGVGGSVMTGTGGVPAAGGTGIMAGGSAGMASTPEPGEEPAEAGCGCRVGAGGSSAGRSALTTLGLGALGLLLRRRRR